MDDGFYNGPVPGQATRRNRRGMWTLLSPQTLQVATPRRVEIPPPPPVNRRVEIPPPLPVNRRVEIPLTPPVNREKWYPDEEEFVGNDAIVLYFQPDQLEEMRAKRDSMNRIRDYLCKPIHHVPIPEPPEFEIKEEDFPALARPGGKRGK